MNLQSIKSFEIQPTLICCSCYPSSTLLLLSSQARGRDRLDLVPEALNSLKIHNNLFTIHYQSLEHTLLPLIESPSWTELSIVVADPSNFSLKLNKID